MRPILIREFSFQLILKFSSEYWKYDTPMRYSRFFFHIHHGVEVDILGDESFTGMLSALPASMNCSPDSVFSKDLSMFL